MHRPKQRARPLTECGLFVFANASTPGATLTRIRPPDHAERLPLHNEGHARPSAHVDLPSLVVTLLF